MTDTYDDEPEPETPVQTITDATEPAGATYTVSEIGRTAWVRSVDLRTAVVQLDRARDLGLRAVIVRDSDDVVVTVDREWALDVLRDAGTRTA